MHGRVPCKIIKKKVPCKKKRLGKSKYSISKGVGPATSISRYRDLTN
jgi:hypothetical protein